MEKGLLVGLNNKGVLEELVSVDSSSQTLLAKTSLLEMIKGLIVGGFEFYN